MQLVFSIVAFHSIHLHLPCKWTPTCLKSSHMQSTSSPTALSNTSLPLVTTWDMKKFMIELSVILTMGSSPWRWNCVVTHIAGPWIFNWFWILYHLGSLRGCSLKSDSRALYNNSLLDNEQDLICRVYELETGMLLNVWPGSWLLSYIEGYGDQTSCLSWWPCQSTFLASGMWIGYWTPFCKPWFQCHLTKICEHHAELRNATWWTHSLEGFGKTIEKLRKATQLASDSYISESNIF